MDLDELERLARAAREYDPPWELVTADLTQSARRYVRLLSPDVVLALISRLRGGEIALAALREMADHDTADDAAAAEATRGKWGAG